MQSLASIYVGMVFLASVFAPQADIPQVLGVQIAQNTTSVVVTETPVPIDARTRRTNTLEDFRARRLRALDEFKARRRDATQAGRVKREDFLNSLNEIKDERKQKILEKLDERLTSVLRKWTEHWNSILERLSQILDKVASRAQKVSERGFDTSSVDSAISSAETAIDEAQVVINDLASKDYVFEVGEEENLGSDARAFLSQFKKDMKAVRESVSAAKTAVQEAIRTLNAVIPNSNQDSGGSNEE